EPIDPERTRRLVELVLHRRATQRHFDHHVNILRGIGADRDRVNIPRTMLACFLNLIAGIKLGVDEMCLRKASSKRGRANPSPSAPARACPVIADRDRVRDWPW